MSSSLISLMLRENMLELVVLFPMMGIFNILIIIRENDIRLKKIALEWSLLTLTTIIYYDFLLTGRGNFKPLKNLSEFQDRLSLQWTVFPFFF